MEHLMKRKKSYARAVWHLYDRKMGFENYYKEPLFDLGLHHPPCREYKRNTGFYFLGALSHLWGRALDLLGGKRNDRGRRKRKDGKAMKRPTPCRMRLWRLRRLILTLPARVATHARETVVSFLGLPEGLRDLIERYWNEILEC